MTKAEQTDAVFQELYALTRTFTRAYQGHYFYQFHGDIDDLAAEFFTQFITPKARKGEKQTLLDKFDPSITTLPYLVKVSVIRKLIDASRTNPQQHTSLDGLIEKLGDMCAPVAQEPDQNVYSQKLMASLAKEFTKLLPDERNKLFVSLFDSDSPLAKVLSPALLHVHKCPIHQITKRTAVLYVPEYRTCIAFDVVDGHPRGKLHPFVLTREELEYVNGLINYHSQFTKELFEEYMQVC